MLLLIDSATSEQEAEQEKTSLYIRRSILLWADAQYATRVNFYGAQFQGIVITQSSRNTQKGSKRMQSRSRGCTKSQNLDAWSSHKKNACLLSYNKKQCLATVHKQAELEPSGWADKTRRSTEIGSIKVKSHQYQSISISRALDSSEDQHGCLLSEMKWGHTVQDWPVMQL